MAFKTRGVGHLYNMSEMKKIIIREENVQSLEQHGKLKQT